MHATLPAKKSRVWTDEELEALPKDGHKYELLEGDLITSPIHLNHGRLCVRIGSMLLAHVETHDLGDVFDSSTGFRLSDDLLLSPDVAFVSKARMKSLAPRLDKFFPGAPDLVVEVLSPSDRMTQINRKLEHYLEHGTKLAWLINWQKEQVHIYTPDGLESLTDPDDTLGGGQILPGFKCKLRRLFGPR
jgi:Uma2 family endonuclease